MIQRWRDRALAVVLAPRFYYPALFLIALAAGLHQFFYILRPDGYTRYNNYLIFKQAFVHLVHSQDLYALYPAEHFDRFLYSPAFALLMAPFAHLPDVVGLLSWDLLNTAVLVLALWKLPGIDSRSKGLLVWFLSLEFLVSTQHSQSNVLVLGLLILCFDYLERGNAPAASLLLALAGAVKIFPLAAGVLFLLYPQRLRLVAWTAAWLALLALLPLLVVPPHQLEFLYGSWYRLHTAGSHSLLTRICVEGFLNSWLGVDPPRTPLVAAGAALTLAPLWNVQAWDRFGFRLHLLASLLMWMILFNHLSEGPTYVIAMGGAGLWLFSQPRTPARRALAVATYLVVSLTYSDLMPMAVKVRWVRPYVLKAVGIMVVWLLVTAELLAARRAGAPAAAGSPPGPDSGASRPSGA